MLIFLLVHGKQNTSLWGTPFITIDWLVVHFSLWAYSFTLVEVGQLWAAVAKQVLKIEVIKYYGWLVVLSWICIFIVTLLYQSKSCKIYLKRDKMKKSM